jgi:hypothetical protein
MRKLLTILGICLTSAACPGAGIRVIGGLTREMTLQPGDRVQSKILLQNQSDRPQQVKVFQTDYLFYASGVNDYGKPGSGPRSNATWISFAPRLITLSGRELLPIDYIVQVPQKPELAGTYWSLLMIEPIAAEKLEPKPGAVGIDTVLRYAVQIVTNIGQTGTRALQFKDRRLALEGAPPRLQIDVENTGERWLRPLLWAEFYDHTGADLGRFPAQQLRIYPGCSARFQFELSSLPHGDYTALVVGDNGDEYVFGARYEFTLN